MNRAFEAIMIVGLLLVILGMGMSIMRLNKEAEIATDICWRDKGQFITLDIPEAHGFTIYIDTDSEGKIHTYVLATDNSPKNQHEWVYIGILWETNDDGCVCGKCGMSRPWALKHHRECTKK